MICDVLYDTKYTCICVYYCICIYTLTLGKEMGKHSLLKNFGVSNKLTVPLRIPHQLDLKVVDQGGLQLPFLKYFLLTMA